MSPRRSPARLIAPLALIVAATAVYALVAPPGPKGPGPSQAVATRTAPPARRPSPSSPRRAKTYVVRPGDTLSGIAAKTGLSVEHIQALNAPLDANTLAIGRRLKLRG